MKIILLASGEEAKVDDEDFEAIRATKWWLLRTKSGKLYAYRPTKRDDGSHTTVLMHREIMRAKPRQIVDHENGNGLDNQKGNLRACTSTQNNANCPKRSGCSSKFKGVSWNIKKKKWQASIRAQHVGKFLGYFDDEVEAAKMYDAAAKEAFGNFAKINFP